MDCTYTAYKPSVDWRPGDGIPWVCPECWFRLGESKVPQSEAFRRLNQHISNDHLKRREQEHSNDSDSELTEEVSGDAEQPLLPTQRGGDLELISPSGKKMIPCPHCPNPVREDRLAEHISRVHSAQRLTTQPAGTTLGASPVAVSRVTRLSPPEIPVERFSFQLLPPGSWEIDDVVRHYRQQAQSHPGLFANVIDYGRIEAMKSLRPIKCYIGQKVWNGYVVFEFEGTSRVVLDCPVEGNAIYVLSGDWKRMVRRTKKYLRTKYPNDCTRIVHKGEWLERVRYAL